MGLGRGVGSERIGSKKSRGLEVFENEAALRITFVLENF